MTKSEAVGPIDSRKELNKYLGKMSDKAEATRLKELIKEYGLQREVEAYEEVKDFLDEGEFIEAWTHINGFPVMAFNNHVTDKDL